MDNQPGTSFNDVFESQRRPWLVVLVLAIAINLAGIGTDFFTNDPGLYGLLARNMVQSHNYINVVYRGHDWLDKPHFPFWMVALSFNTFGFTAWAYKLPALLFYFMSVVYTYKLAKKFYGFDTALIAVLVLLTAQHAIMSNTDVRAEPYIMGLLMGAVYHFSQLKDKFSVGQLLIASLFAACAVMTKGIYLLIPIGSAIIGDYLFKKDFKGLLQWRWLMAVVLVAIFTLPEIYTLYVQFDLHPEKVVFKHTHVSGIHWFLWDSQFGRFNNTGYIIRPNRDVLFFVHTLLWAFAPWGLILYYGLFTTIRNIIKGINLPEYVALSGAFLMFVIFSVSQFQLPFYTNILFPLFAIITAAYTRQINAKLTAKLFKITQYIICTLLLLLITLLSFVFAPEKGLVFLILTLALTAVAVYIFKSGVPVLRSVFLFTCCVCIWANAYIITVVYPVLVNYKAEVVVAKYINDHVSSDKAVAAKFDVPDSFEFYTNRKVSFDKLYDIPDLKNKHEVVLLEDTLMGQVIKQHIPFKLLRRFDNYPNEILTLPFLMQSKRATTLNHYFLIDL